MEDKHTATLDLGDGTEPFEFPILSGTMGPDVVDIRTLYSRAGVFTYDPGFLSTASSSSKITFIDGDKGICSIAAIQSSSLRCNATSWKYAICC